MYLSPGARLAIYAQGEFGKGHSKTAEGVIRYANNPIAAVIDHSSAGKTIESVVGIKCPAPIVESVQASLQYKPEALLLGTAWVGGKLPLAWRQEIIAALESGMDVVNGLHDFLSDDEEIARVAREQNRKLLDVRKPPENLPVASGLARKARGFVVLTVGTDCSTGKMTTSLELGKAAREGGYSANFVATGQTGIMITGGFGIAVDRVIGDFMAGAAEQLVLEADNGADFIFVEGQGSLAHPGYSGVTLSLMHGSSPKAMILCHKAGKTTIGDGEMPDFPLPEMRRLIEITESMSSYLTPAKVVGIAINTSRLSEAAAHEAIKEATDRTGLPATDPVRFGAKPLFDAILAFKEKTK